MTARSILATLLSVPAVLVGILRIASGGAMLACIMYVIPWSGRTSMLGNVLVSGGGTTLFGLVMWLLTLRPRRGLLPPESEPMLR